MEGFDRKGHWEKIYTTKAFENVSWYQKEPTISLNFLKKLGIQKTDKVIDVGGGDSFFVDHLLELGYEDITVLDISEEAIKRAKERLGKKAQRVKWIVSDASRFEPKERYDFWHDRAAFHFLTDEAEITNYITTVKNNLRESGHLVIGTFSEQGPKKCSGIDIKQYSETTMAEKLQQYFEKIKCIYVDHKTPADKIQNFIFCSFRRLSLN